jgi:hypothetical protein
MLKQLLAPVFVDDIYIGLFPVDVANVNCPNTFNVLLIVDEIFNIVFPETFNDELIGVILFNSVFPETIKVDTNVKRLFQAAFSFVFTMNHHREFVFFSFLDFS